MSHPPDRVRDIVGTILNIPTEQVTLELNAGEVEAWDSFGHLQLILALELAYGIQFDAQEIPNLTTVAALMQELEAAGVLETER